MSKEASYGRFFSSKAVGAKASMIRELFKALGKEDIVFFAGGAPAPESFPTALVGELAEEVIRDKGNEALQYGMTLGQPELREALLEWLIRKYGFKGDDLDIIITASSQQALDLAGRVFINPGDYIAVESPTYLAALQAFRYYEPKYVMVKMDDEGLMPEDLELKLRKLREKGRSIKFLYTVPTYQNPSGVTMSESRRKELLNLASQYDFLIIEDNPYSELRYYGAPVKTVKSFDDEGRVIYFGTLSKILAPGLRIGWAVGPKEIIRKFEVMKQSLDLCTSPLNQLIAWKYISEGYLEKHIPEIIQLYRPRRNAMIKALQDFMPEGVKWTEPKGGMFAWVKLPEEINTTELLNNALSKGVAYVPGESFYPNRDITNCLRLNFTYEKEERIRLGIQRLSQVIEEALRS